MNKLEEARQLVLDYPFDRDQLAQFGEEDLGYLANKRARGYFHDGKTARLFIKLRPSVLAHSLSYFIDTVDGKPGEALGYSKAFGHPHLPGGWQLPEECQELRFWLQLDFEQLKPLDKQDRLPEKGIAYIFQHPEIAECYIHYYDGPREALIIRDDLEPLDDEVEEVFGFLPKFLFYIGTDAYDYRKVYSHIPADLRDKLETLLGCSMTKFDSSERVFGRAHTWQGEDVDRYYEDTEDDAALLAINADPQPEVLLFQGSLGDASIHIWVPAADLRNGKFDRARESFSGT